MVPQCEEMVSEASLSDNYWIMNSILTGCFIQNLSLDNPTKADMP